MQPVAVNADFCRPALVRAAKAQWIPSPMPGVERLMLDRVGGEVARATSLVRYAPGSRFGTHTHDKGEEFLVLEGTFSDALGDYGPGTYVRNPPGSAHAPWSTAGCTILVRLRQFADEDSTRLVIDTGRAADWQTAGPGAARLFLHRFGGEMVEMLRLDAGATAELPGAGGLELFVVEGSVSAGEAGLGLRDWLRLPPGEPLTLRAGSAGALVHARHGHLPAPENAGKTDG